MDPSPTIIEDLYAGTLDNDRWHRAILGIADLVSGGAAFIFCVNPISARILRDEVYRFDPVALDQYRKIWFPKDIRVEPGIRLPVGEPMFEARMLGNRVWRESEIFNDFLAPNDAPWFLACLLHKAADRIVNFSINSTRTRGPFDASDGERLSPLLPHLRRALEIKDRLEAAEIHRGTVDQCLESLSFAILVLDEGGRIIEASSAATELLSGDNGIGAASDGTLWLREPAGRGLREWIANGFPLSHDSDGLLHVPRVLARPLSILVTRLPMQTTSWLGTKAPCWMLLLFDPERQLRVSVDLIARDLNISPRESELAAQLVNCSGLPDAARRLRISIHTARSHLKSIFSKTGIGSQAELIRRIATGPGRTRCRGGA